MTFRYAILSAVSSKAQAKGTSLEDQIEICRRMSAQAWLETAGPFIVHGQSRTQYLNLRDAEEEITAIREMLEAARSRQYDVLVVYDHDRLRDLLSLVYASLSDYGVQLFSMSAQNTPVPPDQYDPYENDANELMIGISSIRSKAEIARMRRKYRSGMRDRILIHGLPVAVPFGYRRPPSESNNRKVIPEPIPALAKHIIEIKDLFLRGKSISDLKSHLEASLIPPPRGSAWHLPTIRGILSNPFYAGKVQFEKSKVQKDRRYKKKSRDRRIPPEKIITNDGKHTPLWSYDTHLAIIAELHRRSIGFKGRKNNQFTGLLYCGQCGAKMWRQGSGPRGVKDRQVWRCSKALAKHPSITHEELVQRVGDILKEVMPRYFENRQTRAQQIQTLIDDKTYITDLKTQRARLEDAYLQGLFSLASFQTRTQDLDAKIKAAEQAASTAQTSAIRRESVLNLLMSHLGSQTAHLPAWLSHAPPDEVNMIMHALFQKITLHGQRIDLEFK